MNLIPADKTTLKTHILANTNLATKADNSTFVINTRVLTGTPDDHDAIATWYNGIALSGDNQPLATPLLVWRPVVSIKDLNTAIDWTQVPAGADQPTVTNAWLKWQTMLLSMALDLTDVQVRQGIATVWGSGSTPNTAILAKGCGRQDGTRLEVLLSPSGVAGGRVSRVFGQKITQPDITDAILNG